MTSPDVYIEPKKLQYFDEPIKTIRKPTLFPCPLGNFNIGDCHPLYQKGKFATDTPGTIALVGLQNVSLA
jgi:hypothetical protein